MSLEKSRTKVLVIDDSAIVRKTLSEIIAAQPDLELLGTASDPVLALEKIPKLRPDVLTLDIEMPRMDGLTFLRKLMRFHPMPVIIISSLGQASSRIAIEGLAAGAVEVVAKPGGPYSLGELKTDLPQKIRAAARARLARAQPASRFSAQESSPAWVHAARSAAAWPGSSLRTIDQVIAIGASTGGVQALQAVLESLPESSPPLVVVQHIPPVFSREFACRLNKLCRIRVREATHGAILEPGLALLAPGNYHMALTGSAGRYRVELSQGPPVHYQRPAVDVLFHSVARVVGKGSLGVILTGMGSDGAEGLLAMKCAGARTIAQDEQSCAVFGMPREAIRLGAVDTVLPLSSIGPALARHCPIASVLS